MTLGVILFVLGLVVGSAINSFLWRYQTKTTFAGRSMCPICKHQLSWHDNIPLISWFLLSGKCRYCKKSIAVQYPIVELLSGILFAIVGLYSTEGKAVTTWLGNLLSVNPNTITMELTKNITGLILLLAITTLLTMITVHDYQTKEIPNGFSLTFTLLSLSYLVTSHFQISNFKFQVFGTSLAPYLVAALVAFLFFYSFVFFSHETWMGGGDAKLAFGMGILLGPAGTFLSIMIASVTGSVYGVSQVVAQRAKAKIKNTNSNIKTETIKALHHEIPFGPFLAMASFIALIFGPQIIDWYVKIVIGI